MRGAIVVGLLSACYSPQLGPCAVHCGPDSPCPDSLTCAADKHCHDPGDARVCPQDFLVKITKAGTGTGLVTGDLGVDCGSICTSSATAGTSVMLFASPDASSRFAGWTGTCTGADICLLTLDADKTVGAQFNLARTLTVLLVGSGTGTVVSMPAGINCSFDCAAQFDVSSTVRLMAAPDVGSTFIGWEAGPCSGDLACTVTLSSDMQVTARFE